MTGSKLDSYILEYADDYSWLMRGDNYSNDTGFIDLVAKAPTVDAKVVTRALELAKQYKLKFVHYSTRSTDCDYDATLVKMQKISAL